MVLGSGDVEIAAGVCLGAGWSVGEVNLEVVGILTEGFEENVEEVLSKASVTD